VRKFIRFCWDTIGVLLQIKDIVFIFVGVTGGGAAVITFVKQLPVYIPIIVGSIAFALIIFEFFRVRTVYKMWDKLMTEKDPVIEKIIKQLLDMHLKLKETSETYYKNSLTKKQAETIMKNWLRSLGVKPREVKEQKSLKSIQKLLKKRFKRVYKVTDKDYSTISGVLADVGEYLDKINLGLDKTRKTKEYSDMYKELLHLELELPVTIKPPSLDLLERVYQTSYGLLSYGLFMMLSHNRYGNKIPDKLVGMKDTYIKSMNLMYMKTLTQARGIIVKAFVKETGI
jgi:hypothetical protein